MMIEIPHENCWDAEVRVEPPLEFEDALLKLRALAIAHYRDGDFARENAP